MDIPLGDSETELFSVTATRETEVKKKAISTQTTMIEMKTAETDMPRESKEVQTDPPVMREARFAEASEERLFNFLSKVTPVMESELDKAAKSTAFLGYSLSSPGDTNSISLRCALRHEPLVEAGLHCTGVAWSCTGAGVIASYGRYDHTSFCTHKGYACGWYINRRSMNPERADFVLESSSCIMSVSAHPTQPSIIACGTYSGDVLIFDTGRDETLVCKSAPTSTSHRESVTCLWWLPTGRDDRAYKLVSMGSEGRVLVWDPANNLLFPVGGYLLAPPGASTKRPLGGTNFSFSSEDTNSFIAGSENGGLYKCSLSRDPTFTMSTVWKQKDEPPRLNFPSSSVFLYEPHAGPITASACSPYHRNAFMSASADGSLRVFGMLRRSPVFSVETSGPIECAAWSRTRPAVIYTGTRSGELLVFDIQAEAAAPVLRVDVADARANKSTLRAPVYALSSPVAAPELIATVDGVGYVCVWTISRHLLVEQAGERALLSDLVTQEA